MILQRRNYKNRKYDQYRVPDKWNCQSFCENMKEIVNCPHCGKELEFGKCYISLEFHAPFCGFGYAVCSDCYEKEWKRRNKYKK